MQKVVWKGGISAVTSLPTSRRSCYAVKPDTTVTLRQP